jgi:hypothetical protein
MIFFPLTPVVEFTLDGQTTKSKPEIQQGRGEASRCSSTTQCHPAQARCLKRPKPSHKTPARIPTEITHS